MSYREKPCPGYMNLSILVVWMPFSNNFVAVSVWKRLYRKVFYGFLENLVSLVSVFLWGWCFYMCTKVLIAHATKTFSRNLQNTLQDGVYSEHFYGKVQLTSAHCQWDVAEQMRQPFRSKYFWLILFQDRFLGTQCMFWLVMTAHCIHSVLIRQGTNKQFKIQMA